MMSLWDEYLMMGEDGTVRTEKCQLNCTEATGTLCAMREPHERLRLIRQLRGFDTASEAARRFGWNENTYKSAENGTRELSKKTAKAYAVAYKVPLGWLLFGEGSYDGALSLDVKSALAFERIPLLDWSVVTSSANIQEAVRTATGRADTAPSVNFGPLAFALRVADESMTSSVAGARGNFFEGDEIVFDPEKDVTPGNFVLARVFARNATVFRQYREAGYTDGGAKVVTLHPLNPNYGDETIILGETGEIIAKLVRHSHDYA